MDGIEKTERATGRRGVCKIILTAVAAIVMLCAAAVAYAMYAGGGRCSALAPQSRLTRRMRA